MLEVEINGYGIGVYDTIDDAIEGVKEFIVEGEPANPDDVTVNYIQSCGWSRESYGVSYINQDTGQKVESFAIIEEK